MFADAAAGQVDSHGMSMFLPCQLALEYSASGMDRNLHGLGDLVVMTSGVKDSEAPRIGAALWGRTTASDTPFLCEPMHR